MTRRLISSGSTFERDIGYSRAVVDGEWIFVSGTTGFDYAAMTISDDVVQQADQCLRNIQSALGEAGASLADVVRVHYILPNAADFAACWPTLRKYFGDVRPAATMMAAGLADPRMRIEIEVTAVSAGQASDAAERTIACPGCGASMAALRLEGHGGSAIVSDCCTACRVFWFDAHESLQLAPGSTLRLFTLIGEHPAGGGARLADVLRCPRCAARLLLTHDRQRATAFQYWRCDHGHGRLIGFFDFLREKDFIRPLTTAQIAELRTNVQTVNCSNCGGPVDLAAGSACPHCGSPLSMLDMKQAGELVNQLRRAAEPRPIDPALPLELARARREVEASFASLGNGGEWEAGASASGLVEAGLSAVMGWLKKSGH